ncbi:hypothetical protein AeRB84_015859 [Aphanomyces euteiches]|nr:hypothetical protein AeRB84_015859 [Aphanomyces euteiches]
MTAATLMESELMAQRDVAKEMVHEMRKQLNDLQKRESLIERRALRAELRRHEFETALKSTRAQLQYTEANFNHHLIAVLLGALLGALLGWLGGIVLVLCEVPAFVAFFLMGPCVAIGSLVGAALGVAHRQEEVLRLQRRRKKIEKEAPSLPPSSPVKSSSSLMGTALGCAKDLSFAVVEYVRS